jgi:hypothetical protein
MKEKREEAHQHSMTREEESKERRDSQAIMTKEKRQEAHKPQRDDRRGRKTQQHSMTREEDRKETQSTR